jgi:hypothetical protein
MRALAVIGLLALTGCATQPQPLPTMSVDAYKLSALDCRYASNYRERAKQVITMYSRAIERNDTLTPEQWRGYKLHKTLLWDLREKCHVS